MTAMRLDSLTFNSPASQILVSLGSNAYLRLLGLTHAVAASIRVPESTAVRLPLLFISLSLPPSSPRLLNVRACVCDQM